MLRLLEHGGLTRGEAFGGVPAERCYWQERLLPRLVKLGIVENVNNAVGRGYTARYSLVLTMQQLWRLTGAAELWERICLRGARVTVALRRRVWEVVGGDEDSATELAAESAD